MPNWEWTVTIKSRLATLGTMYVYVVYKCDYNERERERERDTSRESESVRNEDKKYTYFSTDITFVCSWCFAG